MVLPELSELPAGRIGTGSGLVSEVVELRVVGDRFHTGKPGGRVLERYGTLHAWVQQLVSDTLNVLDDLSANRSNVLGPVRRYCVFCT